MIRLQVRDLAGNVFAFHDFDDNGEALGYAVVYVAEGFRVELVPLVGTDPAFEVIRSIGLSFRGAIEAALEQGDR